MDRAELENKLAELKTKQAMIDKSWKKTGNRELLQFFIEVIPKAIKAERMSIFIHDPVDANVWVHCGTNVDERQIEVPQAGSVVGRTIATGKPIFENNMQQQMGAHDNVAIKTGYVTYNTLCVPVRGVTTDKITGAIQAVNKIGMNEFTEGDLTILEKLAFHIQMHIENIYLRQEMAKISSQMSEAIVQLERKLNKM
jgi:transcriptional regulator with GAF, ATPase, and Fis domain